MPQTTDIKTTWNLSPLLNSDTTPEIPQKLEAAKKANEVFINKWKDRTDYLEKPEILKQALDEYERLEANFGLSGDVGYYFSLRSALDQEDPVLKAQANLVEEQERLLANELEFFEHRLSKVSPEKQREFLTSPLLTAYKHFLERLFELSKYLLSEAEEKILNLKSKTAHENWVRMTSDFLARETAFVVGEDGKRSKKTFAELSSLLNSKDKITRDSAAAAFNKIVAKHADVAEAELNSILEDKKTDDALRKISRPDLTRHISDDISPEIVDTLIENVEKRFDISRRYYELKAKLFGVPKLAYHERNVEYGDIDKKFSFDEAVDLVTAVLRKLDGSFSDIFSEYVRNGQIDVYPKKGKAGGAFSAHGLKTQPGYVLLNHTNRLQDVMTLAHEMGHAINGEMLRVQNSLNFDTPKSTAEVASTFFESFVLDELRGSADDKTKLVLIMHQLNEEVSTIQRQIACYKFEQELHAEFRKRGYLSKKDIGGLFSKNMSAYMGDFVEQSKGSENWWVYWGHIRSFFYVYSYASGYLIAKAMKRFVRDNPGSAEKLKTFLAAGASDTPQNIFRVLGIDITQGSFWEKGLNEIAVQLNEAESLAKKLNLF